MSRTKEFDPDTALDVAMRLFWDKGFAATSTADLVDATGVARASLYATFGSKHDLYVKALDRYLGGHAGPPPDEIVAAAPSGLDAVLRLLNQAAEPARRGDPRGCFSVQAAADHKAGDPEIHRRLEANRQRLEGALYAALLRAREEGAIRASIDVQGTARMLLSLVTGLRLLARADKQHARITETVSSTLELLAA